ncbi:MAG TPA: hypothetical protein VKT52_05805 [Ktedonobacterales bacterium]|nr:hypothetical protein [Ktedonobacterales bacterium]
MLLISMALDTTPVVAQTRPAPQATQHALDELANCRAQHRPECPPDTATPTLAPTSTSVPSATWTPEPTDTPVPAPTKPPLPMPSLGYAVAGYVRPTSHDPSDTWLELALPQGRWAILYDATLCAPPPAWTNVWLALDDQSDRPITADRDDSAMCAVAQWSWSSDVPCAADDQGVCDVNLDAAYWDALARAEPTATDTPSETSTPTPRGGAQPVPAAVRPPSAEVRTVIQTVVVVVTVVPTDTPVADDTATLVPTRRPTSSPTPTRAATATSAPTRTPTVAVAAAAAVPPGEPAVSVSQVPNPAPGHWDWGSFLELAAAVLALLVVVAWLLTRRKVVVWGTRPNRAEDSHA